MKKLFGIFSLLVLTLSNVLPAYTYANTETENEAIKILNQEIEKLNNELSGNNQNFEWNDLWLNNWFWLEYNLLNTDVPDLKETTLITWNDFNIKVKRLTNNSVSRWFNDDYTIKYIKRSKTDDSEWKNTVILSTTDSAAYPVKAWFENENGTWIVYYYTEADKIYLNEDSKYMFSYFRWLITVDLSEFDSTKVRELEYFFWYDDNLQELDFSGFRTPNLVNMKSIIRKSTSIKKIDLSTFDTSKVTNMQDLFEECTSLETVIIDNRDLRWWSSLWNLGQWIYYNNSNLKYTSAKNWKVPSNLALWLNTFFYGYNWLRWVIDVTDWDTSLVTDMHNAFYWIEELTWVIWLNTWDTSNVTDMNHMFQSSKKLESLNLSWWDTSKVENMYAIFENCSSLKEIKWLDTWNTRSLKDMWCMFNGCTKLKEVNLDNRDVSNLGSQTNGINIAVWWSSAFANTDSLEKVSFRWWKLPDNLQSWYSQWTLNYSWITSIDVSNWQTSNVKKMNTMFTDIKKNVNIIWLDTWDTSNVENMWWMFTRSYWLESLDLSNFDTRNVTNIQWMFQGASNLKTIYAGDKFIVNDWVPSTDMFSGAVSLIWWNWTEFDEGHIDSEYARWDIEGISWYFNAKTYNLTYETNWWTLSWEENTYKQSNRYILPIPIKSWNEFVWWYESWTDLKYTYVWGDIKWDKMLYAQWKIISESQEQTPSAWWWRSITPTKQETKSAEQEHNSADLEKTTVQENVETTIKTTDAQSVEEKINKIQWRSLTRWEVAVMTNILLDVYPQLTENRELNEVSEACENYADEQNFTKDEKKAITRLCKLSIMWIHRDTKEPLDEFMVKQMASNDEFATVMDRVVANYTEKDLSVVKEALKKLEWNEENVVFGTVYDVFMSIKNIFG